MFDLLDCAVSDLGEVARTLEPATLDATQAKRVLCAAADAERLAVVIKALAAKRLDETNEWKHSGARSPEAFVANTTGSTVSDAKATVALGSQLEALPVLNNAARSGRLSPAAAKMIGEAATADPSAEADLLEAAAGGLTKLRDECTRVKLAAAGADHQARLRAERTANTKIVDGAFTVEGIGDLASGASFIKILDALQEKEFELARKQGRHESYGAYRYDALMRMAEYAHRYATGHQGRRGADEPAVPKFTGLAVQLIIVANAQAWKRGHAQPGETVEIVGIGPIDVATAKEMVGDAFIDLVVTNGIGATTLVHASRKATKAQLIALLAGRYECNVEGCDARTRLQIDHIGTNGWANTQQTAHGDLALKCHHCHDRKTNQHWIDGPLQPNGKRTLIPPGQHANAPPDAEDAA